MTTMIRARRSLLKTALLSLATISLLGSLVGCVKYRSIKESDLAVAKPTKEEVFNAVSAALVDQGYDIKLANKDIGIVTTEFKKYWSISGNPPFDLYMQLKCKINQGKDGKIKLAIVPWAQSRNRLNPGAFTESEPLWDASVPEGFADTYPDIKNGIKKGVANYKKALRGIAESLGTDPESFQHDLTEEKEYLF